MSLPPNECSRGAKRRKLRIKFIDLTCDLNQYDEENPINTYELADIKDSCQIKYKEETIEFNVRQLKHVYTIGEGFFGIVTLAQLADRPDVVFACKRMTLEKLGNNDYSSQSDLKAMRTVGNEYNPHIVHFYAALVDLIDGQLVICMEALETSMDKFYPILHTRFSPQPVLLDLLIRRLGKHIVLALDYLKSKNIIHRDVKPQNILVARTSVFKLCDFGICGILKDSLSSTHLGSMRYLPPERLGNICPYGTRSDMWALGMSLLEVSQGFLPLESESIMSFMTHIKNGWQPDIPVTLLHDTRDLLSSLLRHDVNQRPRYYSDILSMPAMTSVEEKPSTEEVILVNNVIDALPPKIPE